MVRTRFWAVLVAALLVAQAWTPALAQGKRIKEGGGGSVTAPVTPSTPGGGGSGAVVSGLPVCDRMPDGVDDFACECPAGFAPGTVWGSDPYTADSDICTAAQHKGLISPDGGLVRLIRAPGRSGYPGSFANGVETQSWGSYDSSVYLFPGKPAVAEVQPGGSFSDLPECGSFEAGMYELNCSCPAGFTKTTIWGSGPYTGDSDICTVALHAGIIGPGGGGVLVEYARGQDDYPASTAHGVRSDSWGSYNRSMRVYPAGSGGSGGLPECGVLGDGMDELSCVCPSGFVPFDIWGSGPYTADSDICAAAQHSGVIGPGGGTVTAFRRPGLDAYPESIANGIRSTSWGGYYSSVVVALAGGIVPEMPAPGRRLSGALPDCDSRPEDAERFECVCSGIDDFGGVWGSDPYSADSDTCRAARHAGVIGPNGGEVTVLRLQGLESYSSSTVNGVETSSWGSYSASITFDRN